jgi:hypothetical protein
MANTNFEMSQIFVRLYSVSSALFYNSIAYNTSWEANSFSSIQDIPRFFRVPNMFIPLFTGTSHLSLSWAKLTHLTCILSEPIYLATILISFSFYSQVSKWSLSFRFPHQNSAHISPTHTCYMYRPPNPSSSDNTNNVLWTVHIITQCARPSCYLFPRQHPLPIYTKLCPSKVSNIEQPVMPLLVVF